MRYGYGQAEISIVNRTYNAIGGHSEKYDPKGVHSLIAGMWFEADRQVDWSAEMNFVLDTYEPLKEAWELTIQFPSEATSDKKMSGYEQHAENVLHDAIEIASNFEDRLFLAMLVVNAIYELEGRGHHNCFDIDGLSKLKDEFKKDRQEVHNRIIDKLRTAPAFVSIADKHDPIEYDG